MRVKLITPPAEEPVTLVEAKVQTRVEQSEEDYYFTSLIKTVRLDVETTLNRALVTQTFDFFMDSWPGRNYIKVPLPPLQSVVSITYTDMYGVTNTVDPDSYILDTTNEPGRIYLKWNHYWPVVVLQVVNAIVVRFVAGYGSAVDVPENIRQAMLLLIAKFYENREDVMEIKGSQLALIGGAEALLAKSRISNFTQYGGK